MKDRTFFILKRVSKFAWVALSLISIVAVLMGFWLMSKMWPIVFWIAVAVLVLTIIADFLVFREEKVKNF